MGPHLSAIPPPTRDRDTPVHTKWQQCLLDSEYRAREYRATEARWVNYVAVLERARPITNIVT